MILRCDVCGKERRDHRNVRLVSSKPRHYCDLTCHRIAMQSGNVADEARRSTCKETYGHDYALARPESLARASEAGKALTAKQKRWDTRRRNLQSLAIQLSRGLTLCRSRSEVEFLDALAMKLNTTYQPQAYANGWFIDGYFSSHDAWIQFDGVYWHSSPGAQAKDRAQDEWFALQGMRLLRITDVEWKRDRAAAVERAARWMIGS